MFWWILNKKYLRPMLFVFNLIVYSINIALISESIYMFLCIHTGLHTDWYTSAMSNMSEVDIFFSDQSEVIFQALLCTFLCACIFGIVIILGYRFMQLQSEQKVLGVYSMCGYERRHLFMQILVDALSDVIICLPLSRIIFVYIQYFISREPIFARIQQERGDSYTDQIFVLMVSGAVVCIVLMIQSAIYTIRLKGKTPRGLINGGEMYE